MDPFVFDISVYIFLIKFYDFIVIMMCHLGAILVLINDRKYMYLFSLEIIHHDTGYKFQW